MFIHWSNTETTYRDMEKVEAVCSKCQSNQLHTFRLYEKKTKHYSAFSIGADHFVSAICHGCLLETRMPKLEEKMLVRKYMKSLACAEGFELFKNGKTDSAIKKFRKVLKEEAEHPQALYGLAKALVTQGKYDEARKYVDDLSVHYSESDEVKELKEAITRNTQ